MQKCGARGLKGKTVLVIVCFVKGQEIFGSSVYVCMCISDAIVHVNVCNCSVCVSRRTCSLYLKIVTLWKSK